MSKPIVGFDLPEHSFTVQVPVLYVRPNDEIELALALARPTYDPARTQAKGSFGRRRVETELAWCYSGPNLLEAIALLSEEADDYCCSSEE